MQLLLILQDFTLVWDWGVEMLEVCLIFADPGK